MRHARWITAALLLALVPFGLKTAHAQSADPYAEETPEQRDARMRWWREARFGMFIHWGVYAVPAGIHRDKPVGGIGEWIMNSAKIPCAEYRAYAGGFNPVRYNPEEWVQLAKEAGMKYIIITSKHHDGFALFASKASKWNIADATPYGKDLLKPLADACRKHGLKLGFYYSQAQDWNHPGGAAYGGHWDKAQDGDLDEYVRKIAIPQVREILTELGPVAVLWWDTPVDMSRASADGLASLLKLQPGIIHNNRLGNGYKGDTETPEQHIPATGFPGGRDWETCMTMNDTWGYKRDDHNWKSTETLVRNLVDIASKGGNYLLNVGPTAEGLIPQPSVERLREIGRWMKVNGPSIYATSASPFRRLPWGRCTTKRSPDGTTLYLHVFDWPTDGKLVVPGLKNKVQAASLLTEPGKQLKHEASAEQPAVIITVPSEPPDRICSVVVCEIEGEPEVEPSALRAGKDGIITLPAAEATIHGQTAQYEAGTNRDNIGFWTDPGDHVEWAFRVDKAGSYRLTAHTASLGEARLEVTIQGPAKTEKMVVTFPNTGDYGQFTEITGSTVKLTTGTCTLTARPVREGWQPVNLRNIQLKPAG